MSADFAARAGKRPSIRKWKLSTRPEFGTSSVQLPRLAHDHGFSGIWLDYTRTRLIVSWSLHDSLFAATLTGKFHRRRSSHNSSADARSPDRKGRYVYISRSLYAYSTSLECDSERKAFMDTVLVQQTRVYKLSSAWLQIAMLGGKECALSSCPT